MYRKHTFEEKLLAVQRYLNGEGSSKEIGRDLGLDHHDVIIYSLRYKRLGEDGLRRQPNVIATYEQKLDILRQYKENCISLDELSAQTGFGRSTLLKWLTDVTQVNISWQKMYLSPILDTFNGEIITYTISDSPDLKMVTTMLEKAKKKKNIGDQIIIHSDQGWHYQHATYRKMVQKMGMTQSMSRKGNCLDNAMMENFFGIN